MKHIELAGSCRCSERGTASDRCIWNLINHTKRLITRQSKQTHLTVCRLSFGKSNGKKTKQQKHYSLQYFNLHRW
ncbi:MAG TPA: hypothetical protein ENH94_02820 [Phycisphaerales bacterium]|nr:hypothetical protein [Phycisphaerales bacterium]